MSTPTRKRSLSGPSGSVKKKKYNCKFQADWMKDFQFLRPCSLSNESSFCTLCSVNFSDVGTFWGEMCDIKELFSKQPRYPNLSKLALACLVLTNSNADSERIFSMLKKIQTDHRSELANDTICSLICAKQNQNMECYEYCPDSEVLKKAKTACIDYNNELKK
jgi:hypothetical protein